VSLKFTYHSKIKYIVVIGHPLVINPEETQSIHAITYILDGPELVVYPTLPLQITDVDLKSNESRKSLDSRFAEYQKQINRNRKRFQNIDQFKNKLTKVLSEAFNIRSGSQKEIKDIVKTMQISLTFQTTNGIFSIKQLIYLSMNKSLIS
jgi:hypothetical protein